MNKHNTIELGWQPIATAPKEGSFLVTGGTINDEIHRYEVPYHMAIVSVEPNSIVEALTDVHDIYYEVIHTCHYSVWVNKPTHWMPLPPLPTKE